MAVDVLTHEAWHLQGIQDEARTECNALQTMAGTAVALGATQAQAAALARAQFTEDYPNLPDHYRSEQCVDGGPSTCGPDDARLSRSGEVGRPDRAGPDHPAVAVEPQRREVLRQPAGHALRLAERARLVRGGDRPHRHARPRGPRRCRPGRPRTPRRPRGRPRAARRPAGRGRRRLAVLDLVGGDEHVGLRQAGGGEPGAGQRRRAGGGDRDPGQREHVARAGHRDDAVGVGGLRVGELRGLLLDLRRADVLGDHGTRAGRPWLPAWIASPSSPWRSPHARQLRTVGRARVDQHAVEVGDDGDEASPAPPRTSGGAAARARTPRPRRGSASRAPTAARRRRQARR